MKKSQAITLALALVFSLLLVITPKVVNAGYGDPAPTPVCSGDKPAQPVFWVGSTGSNYVNLMWGKADRATKWTVAYGVQPGKYIYGMSNFGNSDSRSVKIGSLPRGTYYFVLRANNGCMPGPFSTEIKAVVGGGGTVAYVAPVTTPAVIAPTTPKVTTPTPAQPQAPKVVTPAPTAKPVTTPAPVSQSKPNFIQSFFNFLGSLFK